MKIAELQIENFKGLKTVSIRPVGSLIEITGANDQGKSSILQSIAVGLLGKAAAPPEMIRKGEERCTIKIDMAEFVVDRQFAKDESGEITTKLTVTRGDGARVTASPQTVLNAVVGALTFNPLEFGAWDQKRQFDALKGFVEGFDFDRHDKARKTAFEARTEANRRHEQSLAAAAKIVLPEGPKPAPVVIADVLAEIEAAQKHNEAITKRAARRTETRDKVETLRDQGETLRAQAADLIRKAEAAEKEADSLEAQLAAAEALPAPVDQAPLRARLAGAERVGAAIRAHDDRDRHLATAKEAKAESDRLTAAINDLDEKKILAIAGADLPVEGLDLVDGAVMLDGVPFSQVGTARRITAGMKIALALNPHLKVVLIDNGESLDSASRAMIVKLAEDAGAQVWEARVDESNKIGIVIENGAVRQ